MFKKNPYRLIAIISFVLAIIGIANDILHTTYILDENVYFLKNLFRPLALDWILSRDMLNVNGHNYGSGFFYVLLLLGAILYVTSNGRESRLIRFVFSMIFFSSALMLLLGVFFRVKAFSAIIARGGIFVTEEIIGLGAHFAWVWLAWQILWYFNNSIPLKTETHQEMDGASISYCVKASTGKRFLNYMVDFIVIIFLFSPLFRSFEFWMERSGSGRFAFQDHIALVYWPSAIIYYLFFESILGITPAKLLTQTRVIDDNGDKPAFVNILGRTFSRLVPLEAFSFFWENGWHDRWSGTAVVLEETQNPTPLLL